MKEISSGEVSQNPNIDPICLRDKVIDSIFVFKYALREELGLRIDRTSRSYPYELKKIEGYSEAGTFSSPAEFQTALDQLGREQFNAMMEGQQGEAYLIGSRAQGIQEIYECLRFFWEEDGVFDLNALYQVQRATDYPLWKDGWKFSEQMKPPHNFPESYGTLNDFYQKLEVGSRVKVTRRKVDEPVQNEDKSGLVLGFTMGYQAQFFMEHLIVHFKDEQNWVQQARLYQLEFTE